LIADKAISPYFKIPSVPNLPKMSSFTFDKQPMNQTKRIIPELQHNHHQQQQQIVKQSENPISFKMPSFDFGNVKL
jgi:hypothetical protein